MILIILIDDDKAVHEDPISILKLSSLGLYT